MAYIFLMNLAKFGVTYLMTRSLSLYHIATKENFSDNVKLEARQLLGKIAESHT